jgi:hypothetical protein
MSKPGAQHADDFGGVATTRALTIDLDTHQNLLAVLVSAVDHLPGGHRAIRQALAEQSEHAQLAVEAGVAAPPSAEMCREFIAAYSNPDDVATDGETGSGPISSSERRTLYVD